MNSYLRTLSKFAFPVFACFQTLSAATPVLTTIASFTGPNGSHPESGLAIGKNAVLYGTTYSGGTYGYGTVFEVTPAAGGASALTILYSFTGYADGGNPQSGVIVAPSGALYGTTEFGGTLGIGTVFELAPAANTGDSWTESVLYSFQGGNDGEFPYAGLIRGSSGVLYGVTNNGGPSGNGTVFQVVPGVSGAVSTETVLYAFAGGADGGNPEASLLMGPQGKLYGTCFAGNLGDVFELNPPAVAGGPWTKTILHSFQGGNDGANPQAGLIAGPSGVFYGTTYLGGTAGTTGHGTVYELTPPSVGGGTWTETVLHSFDPGDGLYAEGPLLIGPSGVLYGTTNGGGTDGEQSLGTVFEVIPPTVAGDPWTETVLVTFTGTNGQAPDAGLVLLGGTLYSTTHYGGPSSNDGIVFGVRL